MGWAFVYNKIQELLKTEEFKKENKKRNPNTPDGAINVALWKLLKKHPYKKDGTQWGGEITFDKVRD